MVVPAAVTAQQLVDEVTSVGYSTELIGADSRQAQAQVMARDETGDQVRRLRRRLFVAAVLFMPLCDTSIVLSVVPAVRFPGWQWLLVALAAPVVTWAAWPFHHAAFQHALHRSFPIETLASLGVIASTAWSIFAMFFEDTARTGHSVAYLLTHDSGGSIYLDVAAGVTTFLLAGRYLEARARQRSGRAWRALAELGAKEVSVLDARGEERLRPVAELRPGDRFVVRPGERVATDGVIIGGRSAIDRSLVTGESEPVDAAPGDAVTGGAVSLTGHLVVQATKVGAETQLGHMLALVERAQNEQATVQRLADRISAVFVPVAVSLTLVTLAGWLLGGTGSFTAFNAALSVLIIACPCALGLATPAALFVASGTAAHQGIFFKNHQALEASRHIDTVVLDKTGTVTEGRMVVVDDACADGVDRAELFGLAGPLEAASEHPVASAIAAAAGDEVGHLAPVDAFVSVPGLGVIGQVDGHRVSVGRVAIAPGTVPQALAAWCTEWEGLGRTVVVVRRDGEVVGLIAVADGIRPSAASAVAQLGALGLRCILLSGDNEPTARAVGGAVGIDEVVAEALPADKVAMIRALQAEGCTVAMVGDGVNDAPALATADLGLAVGSGTDAAINAADLIIIRDDLTIVASAISLGRRTLRTIRSNLAWACIYNLVAIPVAAFGLLDPLIAGAAMAISSGFVVWNSSRLRPRPAPVIRTGGRPRPTAAPARNSGHLPDLAGG